MKSATDSCLYLIKARSYVNALHKTEINFHQWRNVQFKYNTISASRCLHYISSIQVSILQQIFYHPKSHITWAPCKLMLARCRAAADLQKYQHAQKVLQEKYMLLQTIFQLCEHSAPATCPGCKSSAESCASRDKSYSSHSRAEQGCEGMPRPPRARTRLRRHSWDLLQVVCLPVQ